jgi:CSLREA domain-containing protein
MTNLLYCPLAGIQFDEALFELPATSSRTWADQGDACTERARLNFFKNAAKNGLFHSVESAQWPTTGGYFTSFGDVGLLVADRSRIMARTHGPKWPSSHFRRAMRHFRMPGPLSAGHSRRLRVEVLEDRRLLAVFTVDNLNDEAVTMAGDSPGTLRQAIFDANQASGPDEIVFAEGLAGTISLIDNELRISDAVSVHGPGATQLVLEAFDPTPDEDNGDGDRIFLIDDGATTRIDVFISGLTLTGGDVTEAGGAILSKENLSIARSIVTGNSVFGVTGFVSAGGGIYSMGNLAVDDSTISNNVVFHNMLAAGGGIVSSGTFTLSNSTVSGNSARAPSGLMGGQALGGGITLGTGTSREIRHSTIAENRVSGMVALGGGLSLYGVSPAVVLDHTIVGNNFGSTTAPDISSTGPVQARFSVIESTSGWVLNDGGNNILNQDPRLTSDLVNHGGLTPVFALLPGSPAIDAGDPAAVAGTGGLPNFDQRGEPFVRVADGDGNSTSIIDIGAYERQTVAGLSLVVDTLADEVNGDYDAGDLSLREAIELANGNVGADTITFAEPLSSQTILLTRGELLVLDSVMIDAAGAGVVTIDASGNDATPNQPLGGGDGSRIFMIDDDDFDQHQNVTLRRLTLTGGDVSGNGGAIFSSENLRLEDMTIEGNRATRGGGGVLQLGGGEATLSIERSTISGNVVSGLINGVGPGYGFGSGGFAPNGGGGLYTYRSDTEILNSTISGNRVTSQNAEGGGIVASGSDLTIRHSTISGNDASTANSRGGNIFFAAYGSGTFELNHTIVADGSAPMGSDIHAADPVTASFSLIENVTGLVLQGTGNVTGLDPKLGPLVENGGPTKTHALLAGSPAIDAGRLTFTPPPDVDQRGGSFVRVFNGDGDAFTIVDIGAYERQTVMELNLVVDTNADENDGNHEAGDLSLREAIGLANGSVGNDTVTFAPPLVGKTILLTRGELSIVDDAMVDATGLGGTLTIDAAGNDPTPNDAPTGDGSRVFRIDDGDDGSFADVELRGLTLTGGDIADFGGGGAVFNSENLTVVASTIRRNSVRGVLFGTPGNLITVGGLGGGIYVQSGGALTLIRSTVDANFAREGGGVAIAGGMLTISSSTVSGNSATNDGGGVWLDGSNTFATAGHSTIAGNTVSGNGDGGGVFANNAGSISLNHTIVADNTAAGSPDIFSVDPVTFSHSLVESGSGFTPSGGPQLIGIDPLLGPLAANGGPTRTHALLPGSPAIDAGNLAFSSPPDFDQRGAPFVRRFDGNGDTIPRIDIGAYERQTLPSPSLLVDTANDLTNGNTGAGDLSLREAVLLANGSIGSDMITFAPTLSGATILLVQGDIPIVENVTIDAVSLPANVSIDASGSDPTPADTNGDGTRIFTITDARPTTFIDVAISGLTLVGGDALDGGGIWTSENLSIIESSIRGNAAVGRVLFAGRGGGIFAETGNLDITASTISGNEARVNGLGGGIYALGVQLTLTNSTISGNAAELHGGGIYAAKNGSVSLRHSTITSNSAGQNGQGGGVFVDVDLDLDLNHTIVANNQASSGPDIRSNSPVPVVYSLVESTNGFTPSGGPRITGQDPILGPLADNGGPIQTHTLLADSPAIDAGELGIASPPAFDQRGVPFSRIVDGNDDTFSVIDIGAYEFNPEGQVLAGDYNGNGTVDAADYVVWRKALGQSGIPPFSGADGDGDGDVTQNDYNVWRANFGNSLPPRGRASALVIAATSAEAPSAARPPASPWHESTSPLSFDLAFADLATASSVFSTARRIPVLPTAMSGVAALRASLLIAELERQSTIVPENVPSGRPDDKFAPDSRRPASQAVDRIDSALGDVRTESGVDVAVVYGRPNE